MPKPSSGADPFVYDSRTGQWHAGETINSRSRDTAATLRQVERRLDQPETPAEPVRMGTYPGWAMGRLWWDEDSTAENP